MLLYSTKCTYVSAYSTKFVRCIDTNVSIQHIVQMYVRISTAYSMKCVYTTVEPTAQSVHTPQYSTQHKLYVHLNEAYVYWTVHTHYPIHVISVRMRNLKSSSTENHPSSSNIRKTTQSQFQTAHKNFDNKQVSVATLIHCATRLCLHNLLY